MRTDYLALPCWYVGLPSLILHFHPSSDESMGAGDPAGDVVKRFIEAWNKLPHSLGKIVIEQAARCGGRHQIKAVVGEWKA
jgi:hypothetical protein